MNTILIKKLCKTCEKEKHLSEFHKNSCSKGGYLNKCKECKNNKMKQSYQLKNQTRNEKLLIKHEFQLKKDEINKKISSLEDPDEIEKLGEEYHKNTQEYTKKLRELTSSSHFTIPNAENTENIKGIVQEYILINKKVIISPDEITISEESQNLKISLPTSIKMKRDEISEILEKLHIINKKDH